MTSPVNAGRPVFLNPLKPLLRLAFLECFRSWPAISEAGEDFIARSAEKNRSTLFRLSPFAAHPVPIAVPTMAPSDIGELKSLWYGRASVSPL